MREELIQRFSTEKNNLFFNVQLRRGEIKELNKEYMGFGPRTFNMRNYGVYGCPMCEVCGRRGTFYGFNIALLYHIKEGFCCGGGCSSEIVQEPDFEYKQMDEIRGFRFCQLCSRPTPYRIPNGKRLKHFVCGGCKHEFHEVTDWEKFLGKINHLIHLN